MALDHRDKAEAVTIEMRLPVIGRLELDGDMAERDARQFRLDRMGDDRPGWQFRRELQILRQFHRMIGGFGIPIGLRKCGIENRRDLAILDHQFTAIPGTDRLQIVCQQHEVGAAPTTETADFVFHAETGRTMQRAHCPGLFRLHAGLGGFTRHPIETEKQQVFGIAVVACRRQCAYGRHRAR